MNDYQYIGGDDGQHFDFWQKLNKGQEIPDYSSECYECHETINTNCFIEDKNGNRKVIGECCFKKFEQKGQNISEIQHSRKDNVFISCGDGKHSREDHIFISCGDGKHSREDHIFISCGDGKHKETKELQTQNFDPKTHFDDGKFKGISFKSVFENDPGYMQWLSTKNAENYGETKSFHNSVQYYLEHLDQIKPFFKRGKYKGRTFESVKTENCQYFKWLTENKSNDPDYKGPIEWYSKIQQKTFIKGVHSGKTFDEVFENNPNYFDFLIKKEDELGENFKNAIEWFKNKSLLSPSKITSSSPPKLKSSSPPKIFFSQNFDENMFSFGKHKGKTIENVWDEDQKYFKFLAQKGTSPNNETLSGKFAKRLLIYYQEKLGKGDGNFTTGKYKNKTYEDILEENPDYFDFLKNNYRGEGEDMLRGLLWFLLKE